VANHLGLENFKRIREELGTSQIQSLKLSRPSRIAEFTDWTKGVTALLVA